MGVVVSGNGFGLSLEETRALTAAAYAERRAAAAGRLVAAGAHYTIDTVADLPPVLDLIEGRLVRGRAALKGAAHAAGGFVRCRQGSGLAPPRG